MELPEECEAYHLARRRAKSRDPSPLNFQIYHDSFLDILGPSPKLELLRDEKEPLFHEAGVFIPEDNTLFVTSNRHGPPGEESIKITKIHLGDSTTDQKNISPLFEFGIPGIHNANGGVNYQDGILFCQQGTLTEPSALVQMSASPPHQSRTILSSFHGRAFNSLNDVVVHPVDGSIWFTDPIYGYEQGFRPGPPQLPNQVYRFEPETGDVRVVADGFGRPNGICFAPDLKTVYITDTDVVHGDGTVDWARPATIYAFTLDSTSAYPTLTSRRVFAFASSGAPDGIKCDVAGNVYSGCGDGVHVWNSAGRLIGKIRMPPSFDASSFPGEVVGGVGMPKDGGMVYDGVANFCFGRAGVMYLLHETRIWKVTLSGKGVKGALLGI